MTVPVEARPWAPASPPRARRAGLFKCVRSGTGALSETIPEMRLSLLIAFSHTNFGSHPLSVGTCHPFIYIIHTYAFAPRTLRYVHRTTIWGKSLNLCVHGTTKPEYA